MDQIHKRPDRHKDRFNFDAERSYTIPATLYIDPQFLEEEKRVIFWRSWIFVCHQSELAQAGEYITKDIAGQRIFIINREGAGLKAFFNVCQHRGHSLLRGKGQANPLLVCPYHAWSYDHDGILQAAPNCAAVEGFKKGEFSLPEIRVETLAGFVFINLDADAAPMRECYPGAAEAVKGLCPDSEKLGPKRDIIFEIKGNWKNVSDNLLECYHCSPAHKAFVDLVDMETYEVETHDLWSIQYGTTRPGNSAFNYPANAQGDGRFSTVYLWPNTAFIKFPATNGLAVFSYLPLSAETTYQVFSYYGLEETLNETETAAMDYFNDVLGPEDVGLVEDVQIGLHSLGYHQGRFMIDAARSQTSEHAAHHFQALVMRFMKDFV